MRKWQIQWKQMIVNKLLSKTPSDHDMELV